MRGKAKYHTDQGGTFRITPACAGKRRTSTPGCAACEDHPRVCGEKYPFLCANFFVLGSPPRVRGKGFQSFSAMMGRRITPACAGKRSFKAKQTAKTWDHPRVCGEKLDVFDTDKSHLGSPPRVRGKAARAALPWLDTRITPACAGKRNPPRRNRPARQDHPRVCGEKRPGRPALWHVAGSPPRVRGKANYSPTERHGEGITPACAGKRCSTIAGSQYRGDHPRVCGEKTKKIP